MKVYNQYTHEYYACKSFLRCNLSKVLEIYGVYLPQEVLIKKEIDLANILYDPNIVNSIEVIDDPDHDSIYLICELCDMEVCSFNKNTLMYDNSQYIDYHSYYSGNFLTVSMEHFDIFSNCANQNNETKYIVNECKLKSLYSDIINGIFYLHNKNLAHCDIKPQNILVKDGKAKVTDFGSVAFCLDSSAAEVHNTLDHGTSTPYFLPPESAHTRQFDKMKSDIWALGLTFYIMAFGYLPMDYIDADKFRPKNYLINWDIIKEKYVCSVLLIDFLKYILNPDPNNRPDIISISEHPFLMFDILKENSVELRLVNDYYILNKFDLKDDYTIDLNINTQNYKSDFNDSLRVKNYKKLNLLKNFKKSSTKMVNNDVNNAFKNINELNLINYIDEKSEVESSNDDDIDTEYYHMDANTPDLIMYKETVNHRDSIISEISNRSSNKNNRRTSLGTKDETRKSLKKVVKRNSNNDFGMDNNIRYLGSPNKHALSNLNYKPMKQSQASKQFFKQLSKAHSNISLISKIDDEQQCNSKVTLDLKKEEEVYHRLICYKLALNLHLKHGRGVLLYTHYRHTRRYSDSHLFNYLELQNKYAAKNEVLFEMFDEFEHLELDRSDQDSNSDCGQSFNIDMILMDDLDDEEDEDEEDYYDSQK
eukprot:Mrub_01494.p1 GENE.Mrub_01494~~Mrub_01494.p1  ORF type:complete len:713 (+),score=135.63 Mrub_01494:197-2140(+)